jgi:hypothetical protein
MRTHMPHETKRAIQPGPIDANLSTVPGISLAQALGRLLGRHLAKTQLQTDGRGDSSDEARPPAESNRS